MTSFLDSIEADHSSHRLAARKSVIAAKTRVETQYGTWFRQATTQSSLAERIDYAYEELRGLVVAACEEYENDDVDGVLANIVASYAIEPEVKTASIHESRQPKMCPFHKDVVNISLTSKDPRAGFDSMAQHWGGPRHCEGDGFEGGKCNFKPAMTTQTFWDEKAEKAQERKEQRQNEQVEPQTTPATEVSEGLADEEASGLTEAPEQSETIEPASEGAEVIDFPLAPAEQASEEVEIPMSMAASTKTAEAFIGPDFGTRGEFLNQFNNKYPGVTVNGEPLGPHHNPFGPGGTGDPNHDPRVELGHPDTRRLEALQHALGPDSHAGMEGYFNRYKEHLRGGQGPTSVGNPEPPQGAFSSTKTADKDVTGLGEPVSPINKHKWTPSEVSFLEVDDKDGPHPTRQIDIIEPIKPANGERFSPSKLEQIGEQVTEHQDVTKNVDDIVGDKTKTFAAKIPHDVDKNPITAIMQNEYDGFLPRAIVDAAITDASAS